MGCYGVQLLTVQDHLGGELHLAWCLQPQLHPKAHLQESCMSVAEASLLRLVVPDLCRRFRLLTIPLSHLFLLPAC
jgi:hypothetical protein